MSLYFSQKNLISNLYKLQQFVFDCIDNTLSHKRWLDFAERLKFKDMPGSKDTYEVQSGTP